MPSGFADAGSVPKSDRFEGNPLCHIASTCNPDAPVCTSAGTSTADAGDDEGGASLPDIGCRIRRIGTVAVPQCVSASPTQGDGATCESGEECAPGFDCVMGESGAKACRRYCCSGSCRENVSSGGGATFCDVARLVDVDQKAPVCMPLKRCTKIFEKNECGTGESCTVVTEDGDTGCVTNGPQKVGESCDEAHCAAELACLGQPGSRRCFRLCRMADDNCPTSEACVTSASFQDSDIGICQIVRH